MPPRAASAKKRSKKSPGKRKGPGPDSVCTKDVATVMKKVRELRGIMKKRRQESAKTKSLSAKDFGHIDVKKEVADMSARGVMASIARIIANAASSIMSGKGLGYMVPSRNPKNSVFIPELQRIVLKDKETERAFGATATVRKTAITTRVLQLVHELCRAGIHSTKRDLFYTDVKLFQKQEESDDILNDAACMVGCTRNSLNVVATMKGVCVGCVTFREAGDLIDCTRVGVGGKAIPAFTDNITDVTGSAEFVLLVEKDAAFMRLAEDRFYNTYPCVIITAKGQPDVGTRLFLKKVVDALNIPVLALMDSDPYGLKILSVYTQGSKNMSYDSLNLTTPDIKWLGIRPSDLDKYNIPEQCRLDMTASDIKMGKDMLNEAYMEDPRWRGELEAMVRTKKKAEIQALSAFGFQYLTRNYLPEKIAAGDWL